MCELCRDPAAGNRRDFLRRAAWAAAAAAALGPRRAPAQGAGRPTVAWARLVTPNPFWRLHGEQDQAVAQYLQRSIHMNFDRSAYAADPADSAALANFPFLYTNTLSAVVDPAPRANLREYLRRGGFVMAEGCLDHRLTHSFADFLREQTAMFADLAPGSRVQELAPSHPIYRAYFPIQENELGLVEVFPGDHRWNGVKQTLYGVYQGPRVISLVSLLHLQCEWLTRPEKVTACLRQLANIYVYAMTQ